MTLDKKVKSMIENDIMEKEDFIRRAIRQRYNRERIMISADSLLQLHKEAGEEYNKAKKELDDGDKKIIERSKNENESEECKFRERFAKRMRGRRGRRRNVEALIPKMKERELGSGGTTFEIKGKTAVGFLQIMCAHGVQLRYNLESQELEISFKKDEWESFSEVAPGVRDLIASDYVSPAKADTARIERVIWTDSEWRNVMAALESGMYESVVPREGVPKPTEWERGIYGIEWSKARLSTADIWKLVDPEQEYFSSVQEFAKAIGSSENFDQKTVNGKRYKIPTQEYMDMLKKKIEAYDSAFSGESDKGNGNSDAENKQSKAMNLPTPPKAPPKTPKRQNEKKPVKGKGPVPSRAE